MAEKKIHVPFPFKGISDNVAFGEQEPGTTRDSLNMRGINPTNGRVTGASRSGLSRFNTNVVSSGNKIQDLNSVIVDNRAVTYARRGSGDGEIVWDTATPSGEICRGIVADRQSNVYALDGNAGIVKHNSVGEELFRLSLPVRDAGNIVRALFVDEFDCIYAGVSAGGDSVKARLWKYVQLPDNRFELAWQIEPGGYIEKVDILGDSLWAGVNFPNLNNSELQIYSNLDGDAPVLEIAQSIPYPVNDLSVNAAGDAFTSHPTGPLTSAGDATTLEARPAVPSDPQIQIPVVDWDPSQLDDAGERIWAWYRADAITAEDTKEGRLDDGAEVLVWRDQSGNGRDLFKNTDDASQNGPKYAPAGMGLKPALRFDGAESLMSGVNTSTSVQTASQQRTMLPMYDDSMFCMFIVLRPSMNDGATRGCAFYQENDNASGSDHALVVNRTDGGTLPGTYAGDTISYFATTDSDDAGLASGADQPLEWVNISQTTNDSHGIVATILWDGGVDPNDTSSGTTRCITRYNGGRRATGGDSPWDRFEGLPLDGLQRTKIGIDPNGVLEQYIGQISEIIVLDRRSPRNSLTEPKVLTHDGMDGDSTPGGGASRPDGTDNEMTRIEGYLHWKWGLQHALAYVDADSAGGEGPSHPYGPIGTRTANEDWGPPLDGVSGFYGALNDYWACICKWDNAAKLKWVYSANTTTEAAAATGAVGYAVKVSRDNGAVYAMGPYDADAGGGAYGYNGNRLVRKIIDNGDSFQVSGGGSWSLQNIFDVGDTDPIQWGRMDVDRFGNVYLPVNDGAQWNFFVFANSNGSTIFADRVTSLGNSVQGIAVAIDPNIPDFGADTSTSLDLAEFMYLATTNNDQATVSTVYKIRLLDATGMTGATRTVTNTVVANGNLQTFVSGSTALATPTGGSAALSSTAQYIQSAVLYQKVYFVDGTSQVVFDPILSTVSTWESTSSGQMPERARLVENWRGRMVLARAPDDPQNWFMSKKDDPLNWDYFPSVPTETDAVAGNNSPAGLVPDLVNAMVPYSDDLLLFGGDHSIWALVGDPAAGGRLDLISDVTGMSWGRPWAKDPNGVLYFFGSRGGLYRLIPGGKPERLSLHKIERRLQDVDLATYYIRLAYNYRDEGIHIFQMPFGAGGTSVRHWFYEIKTDSFWEDQFGTSSSTGVQPTAAYLLDSDSFDDRTLLLGCEDSRIRQWSASSTNDDTVAIDSTVLLGPLAGRIEGHDTQFSGLNVVLTNTMYGGHYEMFAAEDPEDVGSIKRAGALVPGRNPPKWDRVTGPYCWIRLRNSALDENFAIERVFVHGAPAGLARPQNAS
jgi:hypothetical protein